jgi:hypothetical protein
MTEAPRSEEAQPGNEPAGGIPASSSATEVGRCSSALYVALSTGEGIVAALAGVNATYADIDAKAQLIDEVALRCADHPQFLENMDFWTTISTTASSFYLALLRRVEMLEPKAHAGAIARANIMKVGYLGRHDPSLVTEIDQASGAATTYLELADDPDSERLLARQHYERHRAPLKKAEPLIDALKELTLPQDIERVEALHASMGAELDALNEAIALLQESENTDRQNEHVMFANQTANRIMVLRMDGRINSHEMALHRFEELDISYQHIDATQLRAGNADLLNRFHGNTVNRIAQTHAALGNESEASEAAARFTDMQPQS